MGSLLLAAGAKGKRFSLPNSRIMIHQPSGGAQGQATDIEIQAREILQLAPRLNEIYVKHTGQPLEIIADGGRARQVHVAGGGQGVRPHRRSDDQPAAARGRSQAAALNDLDRFSALAGNKIFAASSAAKCCLIVAKELIATVWLKPHHLTGY